MKQLMMWARPLVLAMAMAPAAAWAQCTIPEKHGEYAAAFQKFMDARKDVNVAQEAASKFSTIITRIGNNPDGQPTDKDCQDLDQVINSLK